MGRHYPHDLYEEIPILEAARRCGLVLNDRTLEWDEVEASCPFCGDRGPGKYHLSLILHPFNVFFPSYRT